MGLLCKCGRGCCVNVAVVTHSCYQTVKRKNTKMCKLLQDGEGEWGGGGGFLGIEMFWGFLGELNTSFLLLPTTSSLVKLGYIYHTREVVT